MKRLSLALICLVLLGCASSLAAQDKAETLYLAYSAAGDGEEVTIRGLNPATGEDVTLISLPEFIESGADYRSAIPSPDGRRLLIRYDFDKGEVRKTELFWADVATQQITPIYQTNMRVFSPGWSPDSTHIVFRTSDNNYNYDNFWLYDASNSVLLNPLMAPAQMGGYGWSLDGHSLIAYVVERDTKVEDDPGCDHCPSHIDLINLTSGERTQLLDDSAWAVRGFRDVLCSFKLSPDQQKLAFTVGCVTAYVPGYSDLYLLDIPSKTVTPIMTSKALTGSPDRVEAYFNHAWIDNDTLWVGYFMRLSSDSGTTEKMQTLLYHLSAPDELEKVEGPGLGLVALKDKTVVADSISDFVAYVGTLNDEGWEQTTTVSNICDSYVSPNKQFVAYEDCDATTLLSVIDLQTSQVESLSLTDKGWAIGWVVASESP
jgi:hypothetical protein